MTSTPLLATITATLREASIPFMLTGSVAAAWYGAGRATMDIDLVIDPTASQLDALLHALDRPGIYVAPEAAREALASESMFNVIETETGWKADLIIRRSRPFSRTEFDRRIAGTLDGQQLWLPTIEDLIVAKLEWAKLGNSSRQLEDVAALLSIADGTLDPDYLTDWIDRLELKDEWRQARERAHG